MEVREVASTAGQRVTPKGAKRAAPLDQEAVLADAVPEPVVAAVNARRNNQSHTSSLRDCRDCFPSAITRSVIG
jgi:hypothetical protein